MRARNAISVVPGERPSGETELLAVAADARLVLRGQSRRSILQVTHA